MSSFQKFIANIGWAVLGKVVVQGLLFAVSIMLTRYLGTERLGDYATLLVVPSFEHLPNPIETLEAVYRLLPSGGVCMVRVPLGNVSPLNF